MLITLEFHPMPYLQPPPCVPLLLLCYPIMYPFFPQVHICCDIVIHHTPCHVLISTNPLLRCDSEVCIVCGSAFEALSDHLWSPRIITILLLTNSSAVL
jgi:hypothetical protein